MAAKPTENRAGQQKGAEAADVAGSTSTAGAAGAPPADTTTTTAEVPVHETAGPLGGHYVTGADGRPVAVEAPAQPAVAPGESAAAAVAVVEIETPATPGPSIVPQAHVTEVHEVVAAEPGVPLIANPGPPSAAPEGAKVAHATPDAE